MQIEQSFKDAKGLLGLDKLMNKTQHHLEQLIALVLLAYAIGLWIGEAVRDRIYEVGGEKWRAYAGLFILLRQQIPLSAGQLRAALAQAQATFHLLLYPPVPTPV